MTNNQSFFVYYLSLADAGDSVAISTKLNVSVRKDILSSPVPIETNPSLNTSQLNNNASPSPKVPREIKMLSPWGFLPQKRLKVEPGNKTLVTPSEQTSIAPGQVQSRLPENDNE